MIVKESTEKELEAEKQKCIREIEDIARFLPEPTYIFKVGDEVRYGVLKEAVVEEVFFDGKVYLLKCIATDRNYGKPFDYITYRAAGWLSCRPVASAIEHEELLQNRDISLNFCNCSVESLLHKCYSFGVDMNPEYQRGYVWTADDKEYLLDSVFKNVDIGKFVFVARDNYKAEHYEILDGKQRLNALKEFFENRIAYKGVYFNELSGIERNAFLNHNISYAEIGNIDRKLLLKYFLLLNRTGRRMSEEHLAKIEKIYNEM